MALSGNLQAQLFPNPATLSTGQGAPGSLDPLWLVSPWYTTSPPNPMGLTYNPALINNNCAPGAWVNPASLPPPVNNGNWITGSDAPCSSNTNDGYRYFRLTLNLPPDCNGNSVTTAGNYVLYFSGYADNTISDVFINGNSTGISGGNYSAGGQLNMTLIGPWVAGINYVDVLMYNFPAGGSANPYGLLLVANSTASSAADGDGDGVSDLNDQCPCQPGSLADGCPASIIGDTIICKGESTTLTATGIGTYLWNTGSTNVSITVNPIIPTSYYVLVTTSTNFKDSSAINVSVNSSPIVSITGDTLLCKGESTSLTASGGGTYVWNSGSTNASIMISPASTTNYKVVVTNANGCKDSLYESVTIFPKPIANFAFTNQCNGTAIPYNSISTINNPDIITSWNWDLGDGSILNGSNPSHTYSSPGNYNVTLIVNSNNACSDTTTKQVTVFNTPIAGFTHSDVCLGDSMHFTNTSSVILPASISNYVWNFADNSSTSSINDPTHFYANAGMYTVKLVTTTADGCSDTVSIPAKAFDSPGNAFIVSNSCLSDSATFANASISPTMGSIANWSWDFGDGSAINTTLWSPSHLFASAGNFLVTLITHSTNLGCPDTLQKIVTIYPMPIASFGFTNVCVNQAMNFNDLSIVSGGNIASRIWNFGDGTSLSTVQNPNHVYASPGTFTVSLIVTTNNGCKDSISKSVVIHPMPAAHFSTSNVCDGNIVHYADLSNILNTDTIQSWTWNFGDNTPDINNANSSHLFASYGSYSVQLLVVSNFGCSDSVTKITVVNPNPVVNFKASKLLGCEPLCIGFQDSSSVATGSNIKWEWDVGDGNAINNSPAFDHCYSNDSIFAANILTVILTVSSDSGCVSTLTKNNYITVYPNPNARFTVHPETTTITDPIISITDLSSGATSWNWNFGDLTTSAIHNPAPYTYADTGSYTITLITANQYGCIDTASETVIIEPDFVFYIPSAFTPNGDNINDNFSGKGIFISKYEMTIFDRWGNLIFLSDDINKPWDGKANHGTEIAEGDVYIYSINVIDFKKRKHVYKGIVTLIR